jgi:hypothetical protein
MTSPNYISFGSGVKLMAEDVYIEAMGPNVTRKGFRALCRNLMLPMIEIGDVRYVDIVRFQLAMTAITRIGQEDFFVPGCVSLKKNIAQGRRELDPSEVLENYEDLCMELLAAKTVNGVEMTRDVKESAKKAAERMRESALQTAALREQKTRLSKLR